MIQSGPYEDEHEARRVARSMSGMSCPRCVVRIEPIGRVFVTDDRPKEGVVLARYVDGMEVTL